MWKIFIFIFLSFFIVLLTGAKGPQQSKMNCVCGKVGKGKEKIVGGKLSEKHAYPWIGAFVYNGGSKPSQFCGSTLINNLYVVTAGHCVFGKSGSVASYQIFLGSNKVNGSDVFKANIASIILHPKYNSQTLDNDIALVRFVTPVKFTPRIKPVCLAAAGAFVGKLATVAGWGTLAKGGPPVNQLRDASVRVHDNVACAKNYTGVDNVQITPNMLCASAPGRDSCSGDSGGPLVIKEGDAFRQIGVVSFGVNCGSPAYPGGQSSDAK